MSFVDWGLDLRKRLRIGSADGGLADASLAVLLENVPVTLAVIHGPEHRYAFANRAYRAAVGRSDPIVGLTLTDALGADAAVVWGPILHEVRTGGMPWHREEVKDPFEGRIWNLHILPLQDEGGQNVGVLSLGLDVTAEVEARRKAEDSRAETLRNLERLELAVEATDLGMWEWDVQTGKVFWSERQRRIFGLPQGVEPSFEFWRDAIHPEDRDGVLAAVSSLMNPASGGRLTVEHRVVRPDGSMSWITGRGRMMYGERDGKTVTVRLLGTILDVTERKAAEETRQLLLREMDHRIKNVFAIADGIVAVSARSSATPGELADAVRGRLQALAASHALVRPLVDGTGRRDLVAIADLVRTVLKPFADAEHQVTVSGPDIKLPLDRASALALVLHELATNARKYGGLRNGNVSVSWRMESHDLNIDWAERTKQPECLGSNGFGSLLLERTVRDTLGGSITREWSNEGLKVKVLLPSTQPAGDEGAES
ncbi:HWE histidine kinase domain-containing protein [Chthonobacter rhizosphaerae]|uniref:HWE histidine kinase domain-containing protein n=1 Tax=Chthonobacter rhizosphaerae TaxID=2735553 RepID=UPI0015EECB3D|nr:HWE histidine kinase domain-containing protein [Chthonobacter rhizosphaerae]